MRLAVPADIDLRAELAGAFGGLLLTAVFIAGYTVWDAVAVARMGVPPLLFLWWSELARAALLAPAWAHAAKGPRPTQVFLIPYDNDSMAMATKALKYYRRPRVAFSVVW
jgi:hypothetical protein